MTTDSRESFPFRITEQNLFCRRCKALCKHGLYTEESYSIQGGMLPRIPILCECDVCKASYIAFSQEFYFVRQETEQNPTPNTYVKIPGKNRLFVGNWVYLNNSARPGIIERVISSNDKTELSIKYGNSVAKVNIERNEPTQNEISPKGYRLLPAQCGETLIGDYVYHVHRQMFGKAVGIVQDGITDKLTIQLENNVILFITLPESYQTLPNPRLLETAKLKLQSLPPAILQNIHIEARHGILFVSGTVSSLAARRKIQEITDRIPSLRGTINRILVTPSISVSDEILSESIHQIFENSENSDWAYYNIRVQQGKATVQIGYYKESAIRYFTRQLEKEQGILELSVLPEYVSEPEPSELKRIQEAEKMISNQSFAKDCKIRITWTEKKIFIFGCVHSLIQKGRVTLLLSKLPWKITSIENKLRILKS